MTKIGVFAVWFVVVIGVTSALDPNCDEFGGCKRTKTNDDNSNHTISEEKQTLNKTISLAIPKKSNTTSEDKNKHPQFMPTLPPKSEEMKGRSLNIENNELTKNTSSNYNPNIADLSDVLLREDDEDMTEDADEDMFYPKIPMRSHPGNMSNGSCLKDDILYVDGETSVEDCDLLCTCTYGEMMCKSRCSNPYIKRGKPIDDPNCSAQESEDICCVKITCNDTTSNSSQTCEEDEKVYVRGERVKDDCEGICYCGHNGSIICKDRCPKTKKPSDKCFELPDPNDRCCKKVVCDVDSNYKILSAKYVNETTIKIEFLNISHHLTDTKPGVDISNDNKTWHTYKLPDNDYLSNIAEKVRYIRVEDDNEVIEIQNLRGPENLVIGNHCSYKEKEYKLNEEFSDGCDLFCVCRENGAKCYKYECPTYSGIDILDPSCVEWETIPANFTPVAPKCCPEKLKCKSHGECSYEAVLYSNWQEIPTNVTGCEKRCYCEMGKVECQEVCPPVIATPPNTLPCLPHLATLKHPPGEDCCLDWVCETRSTITGKEQLNTKAEEPNRNDIKNTMKQKKPFDSKNTTDNSYPNKNNQIPSKTLGPLIIYENNDNGTDFSKPVHKIPQIPVDENHYFTKPKTNKSKQPSKGPNPIVPNQFAQNEMFEFNPQFEKSSKSKTGSNTNKTKNLPPKNVPFEENFIPEHAIHTYQPDIYEDGNKEIPINGVHIHGKGPPEELLQIIQNHPQFANYPPGSVLEIHNIPEIPQIPQKQPQYINPNTIGGDNPSVPYLMNEQSQQERLHPNSSPPGISFEHILHHITKNTNFPQHALIGQNGHIPNNGQIFVAQPVFNTQTQSRKNLTQGYPPGYFNNFNGLQNHQQQQDEVVIRTLEPVDSRTVRLVFDIPHIIVGLYGRVEVRYTDKRDNDPSSWSHQVFAPPNDLLATPQLEFQLTQLNPDTEYKIQITVTLRDMHNVHSSKVYNVHTPKDISTSIDAKLKVIEVNSSWARIQWRPFTDYELEFIDGVQLRYKELDGMIFLATPYIHRSVTDYTIENLKNNTAYVVQITFIPFQHQSVELNSDKAIDFTTLDEQNAYNFNVTLELTQVKATSVDIYWNGVPYPQDKYVNVYRTIYQADKSDSSVFKIAKSNSSNKLTVTNLNPGTRYKVWLEMYLTNGKTKISNVLETYTKPGNAPTLGASMKDKLSGEMSEDRGDYYGPLVIVAILATIAILSTLVLLLILLKRHSQNKASITQPPRISQSAYDNPTYKVEIQQETMNL